MESAFYPAMWKRLLKPTLAALICLLLLAAVSAIQIWRYPQTIMSGHYDCAIVLGAAVNGTTPSPVFQARIDHGVTLFKSGVVSYLVFTGGTGRGKTIAESEAGKKSALEQGVPEASMLIETTSTTTLQNLTEARQVMTREGMETAVIVSDPLHLRRACSMAQDLGISAVGSATPSTRYTSLATQLPFLLREVYFTIHYALFGQ